MCFSGYNGTNGSCTINGILPQCGWNSSITLLCDYLLRYKCVIERYKQLARLSHRFSDVLEKQFSNFYMYQNLLEAGLDA